MEQLVNICIITAMLIVIFTAIYFALRFEHENDDTLQQKLYDIDSLAGQVKKAINEAINKDLTLLHIGKEEAIRREQQKNRLKRSVRNCMNGDFGEKEFLKDHIRNILQKDCKINEETIDQAMFFRQPEKLSAMEQFQILLYQFKKIYQRNAFHELCIKYELNKAKRNERGVFYQITREDILEAYRKEAPSLRFVDKLNILTDRIYERFGHGCIDELRDQQIDGCLGGYSGVPYDVYDYLEELGQMQGRKEIRYAHDSIHVILHGITIQMKFMSFGSQEELIRVTRALVRYEAPFEMTRNRPRIVNDMKDGCRVTAVRPPFSESWAFALRRFDTAPVLLEELYEGEENQMLCDYIRYLVKGGAHIAVCGPQNSGKTTLMKAMLCHIDQSYHIRVGESVFELWMRKLLPEQNILTIRDTDAVGLKEGLELLRKTDGNCLMLGEVADPQIAALAVELSKVSEQQILTNHAMSEEEMIDYFTQAQMQTGRFSDEHLAQEAVAKAFHVDIQTGRDVETGKRYIKSISEIQVRKWDYQEFGDNLNDNLKLFFDRITMQRRYHIRKLVVYENGQYKFLQKPGTELYERLSLRMAAEDAERFHDLMKKNEAKQLFREESA